ncbi:MAG: DUF5979 domain-containing protein, partial [Oscillospiraceae bacterium]
TAAITNTYTILNGALTIGEMAMTTDGINLTTQAGENLYHVTVTGTDLGGNVVPEQTLDIKSGETATVENLPYGSYTVTANVKDVAAITGYTWTETTPATTAVEVNATTVPELVTVTNIYTKDAPPTPPTPPIDPPTPPIDPPTPPIGGGDDGYEPQNPPVILPPAEVPQGELPTLPETEVPLAELPTELPDEAVPMGDAPSTGDENRTGLWLGLALTSVLGMAGLLFGKRKKEENQ